MNAKTGEAKKQSSIRKFGLLVVVVLFVLFIYIQTTSLSLLSIIDIGPSPPDLSRCIHIEVVYRLPLIEYFPSISGFDPNLLSAAETAYLESLKGFVIDDKKSIRQIARAVNSGSYNEAGKKDINPAMYRFNVSVTGYRNDERIAIIKMYKLNFILDENDQRFDYKKSLPNLLLFVPQNMKPSVYRMLCCEILSEVWELLRSNHEGSMSYPSPNRWCDEVLEDMAEESVLNKKNIKELFKCPSGGHYAMNPNCKPSSPYDMVLLFETKAGWNQHGGPELFTFDNHDPKGGCVLFNDGTVKFIRTEEELNNLRWK